MRRPRRTRNVCLIVLAAGALALALASVFSSGAGSAAITTLKQSGRLSL